MGGIHYNSYCSYSIARLMKRQTRRLHCWHFGPLKRLRRIEAKHRIWVVRCCLLGRGYALQLRMLVSKKCPKFWSASGIRTSEHLRKIHQSGSMTWYSVFPSYDRRWFSKHQIEWWGDVTKPPKKQQSPFHSKTWFFTKEQKLYPPKKT